MKKSVYLLLLLPLLAGCKGSTDSPIESATQISLSGSISSLAQTRGAGVIDPSGADVAIPALDLNFARIDQDASGNYPTVGANESPYKGSTALPATRAASTGTAGTAITFNPAQYYLPGTTNNSSKLVGWYPRTAVANGVLTFTGNNLFDGSTDIMLSNEVTGSSSSPFSAVTFSHILTQLQFKVYTPDATVRDTWGTITSIKVKAQPTTCSVTLPGTVAFTGSADLAVSGTNAPSAASPVTLGIGYANAATAGYSMIAPVASGSVTLIVETSAAGTKEITIPVPAGGFLKGNAYVITLNFSSSSSISGLASIGAWTISAIATDVTVS